MTDFLSVKKREIPQAKPLKFCPQVKKEYVPKPVYQFLSKKDKQVIDFFDLATLTWHIKNKNYLQIFWMAGVLVDKINKMPEAPVNQDHQAVLEKLADILEEWSLINDRLKDG